MCPNCKSSQLGYYEEYWKVILKKYVKYSGCCHIASKKLDPLFLWLPAQLAESLSLPLTLHNWLVPSGVCHRCGQPFFLYYVQKEGNGEEFIKEVLGVDEIGRIADKLDNYMKQNILFTVSYCSTNCTIIQ